VKSGRGTLTWPNGKKFEGQFSNDKIQSGFGVLTFEIGVQLIGVFTQDLRIEFGIKVSGKGDRYVGGLNDYMASGFG